MSLKESIESFFSNYQINFEKLDLNLVRNYYVLPTQMSMIGRFTVFNTDEEFNLEFKPMFEALKLSGFKRAKFQNRSYSKLNSDHVLVSMGWKFYDHEDVDLSEFASIYNMKNINNEWKIISVILHNIHKQVILSQEF